MFSEEEVSAERRRRIQVAIWAYAYEVRAISLVSDAVFDRTCREINLLIPTGNEEMDTWFKENFDPSTGQWVWAHPSQQWLELTFRNLYDQSKHGHSDMLEHDPTKHKWTFIINEGKKK